MTQLFSAKTVSRYHLYGYFIREEKLNLVDLGETYAFNR